MLLRDYKMLSMSKFSSKVFSVEELSLGDYSNGRGNESIVRGSRDLFSKLPQALKSIKQIGVIGWSSQGPAQAMNLRDSLGEAIKVKVGLRDNSTSLENARKCGFTESNGTLGEMFSVIAESDLVILLIADSAQVENYSAIFKDLKPGATLGLSHGFLLGHLQHVGDTFPPEVNVIAVCPKGMGPSVRRLYEQGKEINGAGINCSFAVFQDVTGDATDIALGWAIGIGAPYVFQTQLESEYQSDIYGERGILLGAVHGMVEALYRRFCHVDQMSKKEAFTNAVEVITGPLSRAISQHGPLAVYRQLPESDQVNFASTYEAAYLPAKEILSEIYDEVVSGIEIKSVVLAGNRLKSFPFKNIDTTEMWQVGNEVRKERKEGESIRINPITAGIYIATMMAQMDILLAAGHPISEIINESLIEAVDSLNPYMHFKGVSYMVDNCSTTARLGARRWAPRFDYIFSQQTFPRLDCGEINEKIEFSNFLNSPLHHSFAKLAELRPSVSISLH
jgi:ketol-acid reductoisomerase